jgi:nitroreductase
MIERIINRVSHKNLNDPIPSKKEMEEIYQAALRAPDHALLKPTKFIEISGKGLDKLSNIFKNYVLENGTESEKRKIEKYANAPFRAPMVIVLITEIKFHPKVPEMEQFLSTAAAAQNILLAIDSLGYGAIWRTGIFALNEKLNKYFNLKSNQKILGYLYVGTIVGEKKDIPVLNPNEFVTRWD